MKLGLQLGYWSRGPIGNAPELIAAAEEVGFDAVFTAESWGADAYTPLAWWGSETQSDGIGLGERQRQAWELPEKVQSSRDRQSLAAARWRV